LIQSQDGAPGIKWSNAAGGENLGQYLRGAAMVIGDNRRAETQGFERAPAKGLGFTRQRADHIRYRQDFPDVVAMAEKADVIGEAKRLRARLELAQKTRAPRMVPASPAGKGRRTSSIWSG